MANDPNLWLENWFSCSNPAAIRVLASMPVAKTYAKEFGRADAARGAWIPGGRTLGMIAAGRGGGRDFIDELAAVVGRGHFEATDDDGRTAMHYAAAGGSSEVVRALVEMGCDVNASDDDGSTPLAEAATRGNIAVVELLIELGADITVKNADGGALDGILAQSAPRFNGLLLRVLKTAGPGGCARLRRGQKTYLRDRARLRAILGSLSTEHLIELAVDWRASTRAVGRPPDRNKLLDALLATTP